MKQILTIILIISSTTAFGQAMHSREWDEQAKTNMRLLPKYGYRQKTEEQKKIDSEFIANTMQQPEFNDDRRVASNHMIQLGFTYLYRPDLKTAMYRFNQAYLLDSTNADIYWGFGAVYMALGNYQKAEEQYIQGLKMDPLNTHLLTDYGTYFISQYNAMQALDEKQALVNLDSATSLITRSYKLDKTNQNTVLKLSVCYWYKGDCNNAWKFYDACVALGGKPNTEDYVADLMAKCRRDK